ncbi:glycosyltransferase family 4 protein [Persicimonas caeni]|nr:glycosyltransferase family 4 protein [Persicimonas caeni]
MTDTILIFRDYYLPGYKSGGPVQSLANLVGHLGDDFRFKIVTADRDEGDTAPYDSVELNAWNQVGKAEVFYLSAADNIALAMHRLLNETDYDLAYYNSFFSANYTILPLLLRRFGLAPKVPAVVAPRGEFSESALQLKAAKKNAFLTAAKVLGLYSDVTWHASDEEELAQIQRVFGPQVHVGVAGVPLPHLESPQVPEDRRPKRKGELRVGYLGRVSPIKNIDFALDVLGEISKGAVSFDIYGPLSDVEYHKRCERVADRLPEHVTATFHGALPHPQVQETLRQYDVMFLPSKSESFGHAILESLMAACPVLIGQATPWRELEQKQAGWDITLDDRETFVDVLERLVEMGPDQFERLQRGARQLAFDTIFADDTASEYRDLFAAAL